MIFSELYSAYYNTVARIITAAFDKNTTEKDLDRIVSENAFSESVLTIMPSLKSGKWKLLDSSLKPLLKHEPTMPLTLLQKRWLKAVSLDKRVRLFDVRFPEMCIRDRALSVLLSQLLLTKRQALSILLLTISYCPTWQSLIQTT